MKLVEENIAHFVRGGDPKAAMGIGREKLIGDFIEEYNKKSTMNTFSKKLTMEDKPWILESAIKAGRPDIVKLLVTDPSVDPSARRNHFLDIASKEGNAEIIQILLSDPRVNPADHHNIALANAVEKNHLEAVKVLLADSRVNPADSKMVLDNQFNETQVPNYIIKIAALENNLAIVQELLKDPRVNPSQALIGAVSKLNKVGVKAPNWIPMVELLLNNPRTEISSARRASIQKSIDENK
jgi:hypothetical protein